MQNPNLVRGKMMRIIVGDGGYNVSVMRNKLWEENNSFVLAYPHPKQRKKLMAGWQKIFLRARPKVECVFDYLLPQIGKRIFLQLSAQFTDLSVYGCGFMNFAIHVLNR